MVVNLFYTKVADRANRVKILGIRAKLTARNAPSLARPAAAIP